MKIQSKFLLSKLGRRMFWLFALCALTPIALLAGISLRNVRNQMREQTRRELRQISHEEGMNVCERLLFLEADLRLASANLRDNTKKESFIKDLPAVFSRHFESLEVVKGESGGRSLLGEAMEEFPLGAADLEHLKGDKSIVSTGRCDSVDVNMCVYIVRRVDAQQPAEGFLVGKALSSYLLDNDDVPPGKGLCLLDSREQVVRCSGGSPVAFRPSVFQSFSDSFTWKSGGTDYEADYWKIFLKPAFQLDHMTIVASEPDELASLPIEQFERSFLLVVLLTLLVVLFLSVSQIRLNLVPLGKLEEGTRRIAGGDFRNRVDVGTRDEFNDLAQSFNSMAARIEEQFAELHELNMGTLTALARAIDAKSPWTLGHSERVTNMALEIAREMGLAQRELDVLNRGGLLHDIGKIGVPASVLDKPDKLTNEETTRVRDHVEIGKRILEPIPGFAECMPIVLQHHEWFNGGGYPMGLAGEEISLHARIFAIADCYDAMISDRPYRKGMPLERVLRILREGSGKQFDPRVMEVFLRVIARKKGVESSAALYEPVGTT